MCAPCVIKHISTGYLILQMAVYMFQCYSFNLSHPLLVPVSTSPFPMSLLLPCSEKPDLEPRTSWLSVFLSTKFPLVFLCPLHPAAFQPFAWNPPLLPPPVCERGVFHVPTGPAQLGWVPGKSQSCSSQSNVMRRAPMDGCASLVETRGCIFEPRCGGDLSGETWREQWVGKVERRVHTPL